MFTSSVLPVITSLNSFASFDALPGLQIKMSCTMIIIIIFIVKKRLLKCTDYQEVLRNEVSMVSRKHLIHQRIVLRLI
jgi:hypothetical protein